MYDVVAARSGFDIDGKDYAVGEVVTDRIEAGLLVRLLSTGRLRFAHDPKGPGSELGWLKPKPKTKPKRGQSKKTATTTTAV